MMVDPGTGMVIPGYEVDLCGMCTDEMDAQIAAYQKSQSARNKFRLCLLLVILGGMVVVLVVFVR